MNKLNLIWLILLAFAATQCAQRRPITGGAKDVTSPQILNSIPKNFSNNFAGHEIMLEFDEYVQVQSLTAELVVSPPLENPLTYKIKGKRIYFDIQDTLKPNTTYNFNFGNAIVDLNESNPLDSNLFVFSTGSRIDSGLIAGKVVDAYTGRPIEKVAIMLFPATQDSAIYKGGPTYITKTNSSGFYNLGYLAMADYQIYALKTPGSDNNYVPNTAVGIYPELVNPNSTTNVDFSLFTETDSSQYITVEKSKEYFEFILGFNYDLKNPTFDFSPKDSTQYIIQEIKADSFKFWIEGDRDIDSVQVIISDDFGYTDTVQVDIAERAKFYKDLKRKKKEKSPLKLSLKTTKGVLHYFDSLQLNFSRPPVDWNPRRIYFIDNGDTLSADSLMSANALQMEIPYVKKGSSNEIKSMLIRYDWKPGKKYGFIFNEGAFTDLINAVNDTVKFNFKTNTFEDYGSFSFTTNVTNYNGPLIMELLDAQGKFLRTYSIKSGDVVFHNLAVPGKYQIRLIRDENGNGKWDTGDLETETLPEKVVYYDGLIEIRPNWDMEETWQVSFE